MYIPFEPTFLRLLQLPLLLLSPDGSAPHAVVHDKGRHDYPHGRKDLHVLGNLSPYRDAPAIPDVSADLPDDCTVDQVILLHRHGSRGPVGEQKYILNLVKTLEDAKDVIDATELPPLFQFLREGYTYQLVPEELTAIGRKQLFDHGVEHVLLPAIKFGLRYPSFTTDVIISTTVPRVVDSAHFFAQGFFGRAVDNVTFLTTDDIDIGPVSWLTPWEACPKLTYEDALKVAQLWADRYIPQIVARFNQAIPNVGFSADDIHGALYACAYDLAARNQSPWCDVFTMHELRGLEYELDLLFDRVTGHMARGDPGPLVGAFYVKKLIQRLKEGTERLYLDFGHDLTVLLALSTMRLNKNIVPPSPTHPTRHRKFRTTEQAPFAASMTWEKFSCQTSFQGTQDPQVRLVLNGVTFPLSTCQQSEEDHTYGTCSLDNFVLANAFSTNLEYKDDLWTARCEQDA